MFYHSSRTPISQSGSLPILLALVPVHREFGLVNGRSMSFATCGQTNPVAGDWTDVADGSTSLYVVHPDLNQGTVCFHLQSP
jgi:hypothetical protein